MGEARQLLIESSEAFEGSGDERRRVESLHLLGLTCARLKHFDEAHAAFQEAVECGERSGHWRFVANALLGQGILAYDKDRPHEALDILDRAERVIVAQSLPRQSLWVSSQRALVLETLGQLDRALTTIDRSLEIGAHLGMKPNFLNGTTLAAQLQCKLGRAGTALESLRGVLDRPRSWFDLWTYGFTHLTIVEALLETPAAARAKVDAHFLSATETANPPPLAQWGLMVIDMERRVHFGDPIPEELWDRFQRVLTAEGMRPELLARGWHARAKHHLQVKEDKLALEACRQALEPLGDRHLDRAAQIYATLSEAHTSIGATNDARQALERGRTALQQAAALIEDEDYRRDFLARPVFRSLRDRPKTFADEAERIAALYDMIAALNSAERPDDSLGTILDQALRVVRAERGLILLRSEGEQEHRVRVSRNLEDETVQDAARFSRSVVSRAGRGEAVLVVHAANDERLREMKSVSAFGIRSILCVPLRTHKEIVGAVYVDSRADGAIFTQDDLRFLEAFANHAALGLERATEDLRLLRHRERLLVATAARESMGALIGRAPAMQKVYDAIERVAQTHLPVLIQGESGTGKELVAREIVKRGPRKAAPFLSENCAAIAETLLESELFGHVKGAFTGADRDKAGLFEQAHGGTLFLDEVGDMSAAMQARLLRVLQEGELRRVGDEVRRKVDVRLVTATHRDLAARVATGEFREDLLYRLQVLTVQLPPLRDRPGDVPLLVAHFLTEIARQRGQEPKSVLVEALELLERYAWPGNVRQLQNTLQRLVVLAGDGAIGRDTIEQDASLAAVLIGQAGRPVLSLKDNEKQRIADALRRSGGNRLAAAKLLDISRATIFRKIKEYGLD